MKLYMQLPPIRAMDANLSTLTNVVHLALSTNAIERISHLSGLHHIVTLSLARNQIKKLENLEPISGTLQNLWLSYNQIDRLVGLRLCKKLKQLYIRYNKVKDWNQFEFLVELPQLEELEFIGNPLEVNLTAAEEDYRSMALQRLPALKRLDGVPVPHDDDDVPPASGAEGEGAPATVGGDGMPPAGRRGSIAPGGRTPARAAGPAGRLAVTTSGTGRRASIAPGRS